MDFSVLNNDSYPEYEYLLLDELEDLSSDENLYSHDDYNDTQNSSLENNSSNLLEYDLIPQHLKDTIQNNTTSSSNLNSPFQIIPQKSNIRLLCNNPECFNEIFPHFGKGRRNIYCNKQCYIHINSYNCKKSFTNSFK
jgi:hypothetical protein